MTFLEHLDELRHRILNSLVAVFVAFIGTYLVSAELLDVMAKPLTEQMPPNAAIIGTGVAEAFIARILVAAVGAIVLACPFWLYQLWMFIAPGLYSHERSMVKPFVFFSSIFFLGGVLFGYFVVFPVGFNFFLEQFAEAGIDPQIRIREYFSFAAKLLLAFGLCFEMPIVAFFLGRLGIVSWRGMLKAGRYAIIVIFVAAAILTPPDIISQILLAGPLLTLYGLSIGIVAMTGKKKIAGKSDSEDLADNKDSR